MQHLGATNPTVHHCCLGGDGELSLCQVKLSEDMFANGVNGSLESSWDLTNSLYRPRIFLQTQVGSNSGYLTHIWLTAEVAQSF